VQVPQIVNYRYTVVQLRPKCRLLHRNNIRDLHARTSNEKFLAFRPSAYSVSILTSPPLLSCHSGSTATAEIWRHIDFSRWRLRSLNIIPGLVFVDVLAFRRSKQNLSTNQILSTSMVNIISIYGWDIKTSGLEKQTSTALEFYFRFRSRPISRNLYFILHQPAEFRPNRSSHRGNITLYYIRTLNTISGFAFVDIAAFRRSKSMSKPNFVDISQLMGEI